MGSIEIYLRCRELNHAGSYKDAGIYTISEVHKA